MDSNHIYRDILQIVTKAERDSLTWSLDEMERSTGIGRLLFLNAHAVNMAVRNPEFRKTLLQGNWLLRDGLGMELAFRYLRLGETENLNGTDLIPKVIERLKDRKIAVWGSSEEALAKLRHRLEGEGFTNLAPMHHGFHDDAFYLRAFAETRPDVVVLCMGMPRQETLSAKLDADGHDCLIICGGGWANFHSGHIARAPALIRTLKMEWLHRLAMEPRRMGRRYTIDILSYFLTIYRTRKISRAR